jgi:hypothetical protein
MILRVLEVLKFLLIAVTWQHQGLGLQFTEPEEPING